MIDVLLEGGTWPNRTWLNLIPVSPSPIFPVTSCGGHTMQRSVRNTVSICIIAACCFAASGCGAQQDDGSLTGKEGVKTGILRLDITPQEPVSRESLKFKVMVYNGTHK